MGWAAYRGVGVVVLGLTDEDPVRGCRSYGLNKQDSPYFSHMPSGRTVSDEVWEGVWI